MFQIDHSKQGIPVFIFKCQCKGYSVRPVIQNIGTMLIQMRLIHSNFKIVTVSSPSLQFMSNCLPWTHSTGLNSAPLSYSSISAWRQWQQWLTVLFWLWLCLCWHFNGFFGHHILFCILQKRMIIVTAGGAALTTLTAAAVCTAVAASTTDVNLFFYWPHPFLWLIASKNNGISNQPTQTD